MSPRQVVVAATAVLLAAALGLAWYATTRPSGPIAAPWKEGDPVFSPPMQTLPVQGVVYHGMWNDYTDAQRTQVLDTYADAGVGWVRLDVAWEMIQPSPDSFDEAGAAKIERRLDEIHARGMKTLLMFWWAPEWSSGSAQKNGIPGDPQDYATAVAWATQRWQDKVAAIEIWNEPDLPEYFASADPADYAELLKAAYPAIKSAAPDITVVAGAPTGVNTDWYRQLYEAGAGGSFDALGVHPYVGQSDQPADACVEQYRRYYPCNLKQLVELMAANGDAATPIWATEYGWSTHDNSSYPQGAENWQRGVTLQQQADYILQMQGYLSQFPQVQASFVYRDRDGASDDAQLNNYGLLFRRLDPKPGYYALKCAASGVCGPN